MISNEGSIIVFDTETTTTKFKPVPDGHIIEIGAAIYDATIDAI